MEYVYSYCWWWSKVNILGPNCSHQSPANLSDVAGISVLCLLSTCALGCSGCLGNQSSLGAAVTACGLKSRVLPFWSCAKYFLLSWCSVGYSLFAVSASSANKGRIWVYLSALETCFHSGTSKTVVERVQRWYMHLNSQQVELLPCNDYTSKVFALQSRLWVCLIGQI